MKGGPKESIIGATCAEISDETSQKRDTFAHVFIVSNAGLGMLKTLALIGNAVLGTPALGPSRPLHFDATYLDSRYRVTNETNGNLCYRAGRHGGAGLERPCKRRDYLF